jgi:hypothetical protein
MAASRKIARPVILTRGKRRDTILEQDELLVGVLPAFLC